MSDSPGAPKKSRILIADDHEIVRSGIRNLLDGQVRWEVCGEAGNGQEAVAKAIDLKPDVVILDLSMPVMNGFDAAREIRKLLPVTKIVIFSMHDSRQVSEEASRAGADAYVIKSSLFAELEKALHSVLDAAARA